MHDGKCPSDILAAKSTLPAQELDPWEPQQVSEVFNPASNSPQIGLGREQSVVVSMLIGPGSDAGDTMVELQLQTESRSQDLM